MRFSERPASERWAALKVRGETFAEVWFKPEGDPRTILLRIPKETFAIPGLGERLTVASLLKGAGVSTDEVESCEVPLGQPLAAPTDPVLTLRVVVKPSEEEARWQSWESRWTAILGLEATIDTLRIGLESLASELESASRASLGAEEKVHALNSDVAQWSKAKSRTQYAIPKLREFIHRATWLAGGTERKKLEEIHESNVVPKVMFDGLAESEQMLDSLLKDRQVMMSHGTSVTQEGRAVAADVQGALRTVQMNAASNAAKKRNEATARSKSLK